MADGCRSCLSKIPPGAHDCPNCGQPQLHACPYCNELIRIEAVKCRHCKTFLDSKTQFGIGGATCPMCRQGTEYIPVQQISTAGWVVFAILLAIVCWPLCWIGLLMKETKLKCARCGASQA